MADIDESIHVVETGAQKLERLGRTQVISGASGLGALPVLAVAYPVSAYKVDERFSITQEVPVDSGQGYQFSAGSLTNTEV